MCFATAALVASAVGSGVTAYGKYESGQAGGAAADYASQVSRNNATIANQNADYTIASGLQKTDTASRRNAAIGGRIKATQAANGVDVNSGSAVDVQAGQRETGELDAETVLSNAELQAYGYRTKAVSDTAQAQLDTAQGAQARIGGDLGAAGSLLGSASGVGTKWALLGTTSSPDQFSSAMPTDI